MSRDIRSFFQSKKVQTAVSNDEDDVIPESPEVQIRVKKKESRKKRILSDNSDDEFETNSKKKKVDKVQSGTTHKIKKSPQKQILKEVKAVDIFGSSKVLRTEPLVKKEKRKTETGIHSDDEFDQSLLALDEVEACSIETTATTTKTNQKILEGSTEKSVNPTNRLKLPNGTDSKSNELNSDPKNNTALKSHKSNLKSTPKKSKLEQKKDLINTHNETSQAESCNTKKESNKRDFSEFLEDDKSPVEEEVSKSKRKMNKSLNESVLTDEERHERKMYSNQLYQKYLNRSGPKHLGSKEIPKGAPNCLSNCAFLLTGVLDSFERDEVAETITMYGGTIKNAISKKVTHVLAGEDAGPAKMAKAEELGVKIINEDEFLKLIMDSSKNSNKKTDAQKEIKKKTLPKQPKSEEKTKKHDDKSKIKEVEKSPVKVKKELNKSNEKLKVDNKEKKKRAKSKSPVTIKSEPTEQNFETESCSIKSEPTEQNFETESCSIKSEPTEQNFETESCSIKSEPTEQNFETESCSIKSEPTEQNFETESCSIKSEPTEQNFETESCSIKSEPTEQNFETESCSIKSEPTEQNFETESSLIKSEPTKQNTKVESSLQDDKKVHVVERQSRSNSAVTPAIQPALMWVDKYKPLSVKQIIGQHGDASNVKKLSSWLTKWYVNRKAKIPKPSPWAKNDDGAYYKAALLSGPPGVGKTTTVSLVCKELGFDVVEFNASDTRNKSLMKEQIGELLTTTSLSGYAKGKTGKQAVTKKHVLVMDEVDGMAGNEDRGGLQELISLIKSSAVPIICTCNDRNSQKMRSLVNYCFDLRFARPRVDQIKSAMLSICFKEGVKIPADALTQLIVAANQDVRQTLNLLSMWAVDPNLADAERLNKDAKVVRKDIKLGPWEAVRKVFSVEEHKTMSIHDKSDLFFYDYSIAPLFVQENYLQVTPNCPKNEVLDRLSKAADSISTGDLVEARIRKSQAWGLLPTQAMFSSVIPGHVMAGHMSKPIQFPGWLGKNSRANKMHRLCQEIHSHTRLSTSGSKSSVYLDYAPHLRDAILNPLIKDHASGVDKSLEILESYHLLREDLDSLVELSMWPGQRNPMVLVDSKVKAAMTRSYNKKAVALPYAPGAVKKVKAQDDEEFIDDNDDEENVEDEADSDPENDAMIKKKKSKVAEKASSSKEKAGSSKEKASTSKEKPGSSKGKGKKK